jgi:SAM-dependent methyltransferase
MAQDSTQPDFWEKRFRENATPWDAGGVPEILKRFAERHPDKGRVLIPGCGSAYEARYLAEQGWQVSAIDFSEAAVVAATRVLGRWSHLVRCADFYSFVGDDQPFDAVYERAFLCALPRRAWAEWARRMAQVLRPGGLLFGVFYFDSNQKGPPFGIEPDELEALLVPNFDRIEDEPVEDSIPVFKGRERWQLWRRKAR